MHAPAPIVCRGEECSRLNSRIIPQPSGVVVRGEDDWRFPPRKITMEKVVSGGHSWIPSPALRNGATWRDTYFLPSMATKADGTEAWLAAIIFLRRGRYTERRISGALANVVLAEESRGWRLRLVSVPQHDPAQKAGKEETRSGTPMTAHTPRRPYPR